jgi:Suppressor of fused protein (SUFU)
VILCNASGSSPIRCPTVPLPDLLAAVEASLTGRFGVQPARASMSYVGVETVQILRYRSAPGEWTYASLGMSRHPMTGSAMNEIAANGPRAELILRVREITDPAGDVWRRLALLAAAPAVEGVVYTTGMTIDVGEPLVPGSSCTGAMVAKSRLADVSTARGAVSVLEALPATANELAWSRIHGADALRARWAQHSVDPADLSRATVALD